MERLGLFTCIAVAIIMLKSTSIAAVKIASCGVDNTVSESAKKLTVTLERTGDLTKSDSVLIYTDPNTARPDTGDGDGDYADTNVVKTFPALTSTLVHDIIINDDSEMEVDETFAIHVKNYSQHNYVNSSLDMCEVTILDNECTFVVFVAGIRSEPVTLSATVAEGSGVTVPITIGRTGHTDRTATVYVETSSVNSDSLRDATSGEDYAPLSTFVRFPPGVDQLPLTLRINDDDIPEITEYLKVSLSGGDHCNLYRDKSFSSVVIGIKDNDAPVKIASCGVDNTVSESAKKLTVTLERTGDLTKSDSVLIYTDPNTARPDTGDGDGDYADTNVVKTFPALTTTLVHDIIINDDSELEVDETFTINVMNYRQENYVNSSDMCEVTILDNECTFTVFVAGRSEPVTVTEGSGVTVPITIGRAGHVDRTATVYVETSSVNSDSLRDATSGEDYAALSTFVRFPPGVGQLPLTLRINDDDKPEITEYLNVSLSGGDHCNVNKGSGSSFVLIGIKDNDETIVRMRDTELNVNEDVGTACPILHRTGSLSRIDVVSLSVLSVQTTTPIISSAAIRGSDFFSASPLFVTFKQDEDEKRAYIVVLNDTIEELGVESLIVGINGTKHLQAHQDPSSLPARITKVNLMTVVFIRDDDGPFQLSCPRTRISESADVVTCTVERTRPSPLTDTQLAYVSTRNGKAISLADYEPLSAKLLIFWPGVRSLDFEVKIYNDKALEGSEDFFIYLAADNGIDLGQRGEIITIIDDDYRLKFGLTPPIIVVSESVGTVNLTIKREAYGSDLLSGTTSVRVFSREIVPAPGLGFLADGNGVDYVNMYTEVTFQIGQSRVDVQVEIEDDEVVENQEAFEIILSRPSPESNNILGYPYLMTVYINDDDGGEPDGEHDNGDENGRNNPYEGTRKVVDIFIGGSIGALALLGVGFVLLIGCKASSRWRTASVDIPRVVSLPPRIFGGVTAPHGPPPSYQTANRLDRTVDQSVTTKE